MAKIFFPSDDQFNEAYTSYVIAVGRVTHSWNTLQEQLARVFAVVLDGERVAAAVWYSTDNDRAQRKMLRAAITAEYEGWDSPFRDEVLWVLERADRLAGHRNNAVHAPCTLGFDEREVKAVPIYFYGNPRAKELKDRDIIALFTWCESSTDLLTTHTREVLSRQTNVDLALEPWPDRPALPTLPAEASGPSPRGKKPRKAPRDPPPSSRE